VILSSSSAAIPSILSIRDPFLICLTSSSPSVIPS
jgi:hypothetical protein